MQRILICTHNSIPLKKSNRFWCCCNLLSLNSQKKNNFSFASVAHSKSQKKRFPIIINQEQTPITINRFGHTLCIILTAKMKHKLRNSQTQNHLQIRGHKNTKFTPKLYNSGKNHQYLVLNTSPFNVRHLTEPGRRRNCKIYAKTGKLWANCGQKFYQFVVCILHSATGSDDRGWLVGWELKTEMSIKNKTGFERGRPMNQNLRCSKAHFRARSKVSNHIITDGAIKLFVIGTSTCCLSSWTSVMSRSASQFYPCFWLWSASVREKGSTKWIIELWGGSSIQCELWLRWVINKSPQQPDGWTAGSSLLIWDDLVRGSHQAGQTGRRVLANNHYHYWFFSLLARESIKFRPMTIQK